MPTPPDLSRFVLVVSIVSSFPGRPFRWEIWDKDTGRPRLSSLAKFRTFREALAAGSNAVWLISDGSITLTQGGAMTMTTDEFEARVEKLIADARETGMSDEAMVGVLHDAAEALQEGLS